jgi:hypothetical protein
MVDGALDADNMPILGGKFGERVGETTPNPMF